MEILLIISGIIVGVIIYGLVVGNRRMNGFYQVINSKGTPIHFGTWSECMEHAKAQRDYCNTFGIRETFSVKIKKL